MSKRRHHRSECKWKQLKLLIPYKVFKKLYLYELIREEWACSLDDWIFGMREQNDMTFAIILSECEDGLWGAKLAVNDEIYC